ncbi:unnamed protein product [Sphacelaria rigidula]
MFSRSFRSLSVFARVQKLLKSLSAVLLLRVMPFDKVGNCQVIWCSICHPLYTTHGWPKHAGEADEALRRYARSVCLEHFTHQFGLFAIELASCRHWRGACIGFDIVARTNAECRTRV